MRFDFYSQSSALLTVDLYMVFKFSQKIAKQFLRLSQYSIPTEIQDAYVKICCSEATIEN